MRVARRWPTIGSVALAAITFALADCAAGQSIVDIYQQQRLARFVEEALIANGGRYKILAPQYLPAPLDSILASRREVTSKVTERPLMEFRRWQRVPKLGQAWFRKQFADRSWAFAGNEGLTPLDTMMTRDIRARLEAQVGKPTRTLGDFSERSAIAQGGVFEFEYWFVLNDSIPLIITDVNGPFERGVVASTVVEYEDQLLRIRDSFLDSILQSDRRNPYIDYYYDDEAVQWYLAGYDGDGFFLRPIVAPGLNRPVMPTPEPAGEQ